MVSTYSRQQPGTGTVEGGTCLILADRSNLDFEADAVEALIPGFQRRTLRILSQTSRIAMHPPDIRVCGSFYYPDFAGGFDRIVLGANNRVFRGPTGQALYHQLNRLLAPDGEVWLPLVSQGETKGFWTVDELRQLFGQQGEISESRTFIRFRRAEEMRPASSVLSWYFDNYGAVLCGFMLDRNVSLALRVQRLDDVFLEFLLDKADTLVESLRRWVVKEDLLKDTSWFDDAQPSSEKPARTVGSEMSIALRKISYLMSGVSYKAPALRQIILNHCKVPENRTHVDLGGGAGFLLAEMLLDPELRISKGINCDYGPSYLAMAARLYRGLRDRLHNRFFCCCDTAQAFTFPGPVSVVSMFGMLLYVPEEERRSVIAKCWESLEPGGVFVIHETLKSDPSHQDYAVQFDSASLDGLLSEFGEVQRLGATLLQPYTAEEAGEHAVFRFLVKP